MTLLLLLYSFMWLRDTLAFFIRARSYLVALGEKCSVSCLEDYFGHFLLLWMLRRAFASDSCFYLLVAQTIINRNVRVG